MTQVKKKGFALMEPEQMRVIAALGGRTAHQQGRAYKFTPEKAREAARKSAEVRAAKLRAATQEQQS